MYKEDYLLRNIVRFLEELSNRNSAYNKSDEVEKISIDYFGCNSNQLLSLDNTKINELCNKNPELIKALFYILISRKMDETSINYLNKAKEVISIYLDKEKIFDLEINNKLIEINNFLKNGQ